MDLQKFANDIANLIVDNIPRESEELYIKKHKNRIGHLQDIARSELKVIPIGIDGYVYEYGSENLERNLPYYHILEDAYTIKKAGRGTRTSKGSQANIGDLGSRDYGIETVTYKKQKNGSYRRYSYQEYRKNVRGERKPKRKVAYKINHRTGEVTAIEVSNSYLNKHYHYIEKTLDKTLPFLASEYGLKMKRVEIADEEVFGGLPMLVD